MQPFYVADKLKASYKRYVDSSFPVRPGPLRDEIDRMVREDALLWRGPYVSLAHPFKTGATFAELVQKSVLVKQTAEIFAAYNTLYWHQSESVVRLSTGRNTIVATGTGSGKTEAFLIPVIDECLRRKGEPGVKAVLVYPMNALANDQLERLRKLLQNVPDVSFGRLTGEVSDGDARPQDSPPNERYSRTEIRQNPPDILITNYAMLELILTRQKDRTLFKHKPRFLVLDEAHSYSGIKGAEMACLIRRFRQHCGLSENELVCVGTSATIAPEEGLEALAKYASELFAAPFSTEDIITEQTEMHIYPEGVSHPPPNLSYEDVEGVNAEDPAAIRILGFKTLGLDMPADESVFIVLWESLYSNPLFALIEHYLKKPRSLEEIGQILAQRPDRASLPHEQLEREAIALLLLGCAARKDVDTPRYRPKVHLFFRGLSSLAACLHTDCNRVLADGQYECSSDKHLGIALALPVTVCRSCGSDFLTGRVPYKGDIEKGREPRVIHELTATQLRPERPAEGNSIEIFCYAGDAGDFAIGEDDKPLVPHRHFAVCPYCRTAVPVQDALVQLPCPNKHCVGHQTQIMRVMPAFANRGYRCPRCGANGRGDRPIITPFRSATAPSVSILTTSLFPNLEKNEKRLMIFSDSRQETAHQAGYIRDRHQEFSMRQAVYRAILSNDERNGAAISLRQLATRTYNWMEQEYGELAAYTLLTPVDAQRQDEATRVVDPPKIVSSYMRENAIKRLARIIHEESKTSTLCRILR